VGLPRSQMLNLTTPSPRNTPGQRPRQSYRHPQGRG
jgi:hypothetical protein